MASSRRVVSLDSKAGLMRLEASGVGFRREPKRELPDCAKRQMLSQLSGAPMGRAISSIRLPGRQPKDIGGQCYNALRP